ncbi:exosortase family protein XrtG (plasmid) [Aneurinibacillus sp. Ricciae_BoGa-3]|uniref:exosortase family protein XrtG n=1 Tax=Aneurinibacillus sp. Ricciae_BoGa-3 TaxID=3022697 RepID=UPI0023418A1B|nr:exosortase family protein XrtG [Aneurinibacillus sp. Ricciae_BoGa-3]WCK57511.1 exosortase family protein XrtG [Aneurinibacillus sp. Ricciae_BoGa-3]
MMIVTLFALVLWGAFTYALHKRGLNFFTFLMGSIGTFLFTVALLRDALYNVFVKVLMTILSLIGNLTHTFESYIGANSITVFHKTDALSFFISYECSGVIEFLVFASLLLFFPTYSRIKKTKLLLIGFFSILGSNLLRLLFIIYTDKIFGNGSFFLSHMVIGRLIYFALIIALYYLVFTKPHVELRKERTSHA